MRRSDQQAKVRKNVQHPICQALAIFRETQSEWSSAAHVTLKVRGAIWKGRTIPSTTSTPVPRWTNYLPSREKGLSAILGSFWEISGQKMNPSRSFWRHFANGVGMTDQTAPRECCGR